ncbi:mavicyanin [Populus alba x Populus x berolinensis]|nr:mavicyanin [Populus alba x Populus x berolinensis]
MASSQFIAFALFTIILPTLTLAAEHIVGDDKGWTVNFNYTTWACGKVFHVGDTLVFKYQPPHNLYKVDGNGFKNCVASGEALTGEAPAPTPVPNAAYGLAASGYQIIVAAVAVVAGMIVA